MMSIQIIQITNIAAGFILAAPMLKTFGAKEQIEKLEHSMSGFSGTLGIIELALGGLTLLQRMGVLYAIPVWSSYPQALAALAIGLILSANLFEKYPSVHDFIGKLKQNAQWIGIVGIVVGLFSII